MRKILFLLFLSACSAEKPQPIVEYVDVYVPKPIKVKAPPEFKRKPLQKPQFIAPDPQASICLSLDGEKLLRQYINDREKRLDAWEQWGYNDGTASQ
jgi:hypothetical protein